jgi:hypothetical protein
MDFPKVQIEAKKRLEIYKLALKLFQKDRKHARQSENEAMVDGVCVYIYQACKELNEEPIKNYDDFEGSYLRDFQEFIEERPEHASRLGYWWDFDEVGNNNREAALKAAIEKLEKT